MSMFAVELKLRVNVLDDHHRIVASRLFRRTREMPCLPVDQNGVRQPFLVGPVGNEISTHGDCQWHDGLGQYQFNLQGQVYESQNKAFLPWLESNWTEIPLR